MTGGETIDASTAPEVVIEKAATAYYQAALLQGADEQTATSAKADKFTALGNASKDLELNQYKAGAEIYVKKTFGSNNYVFGGVSYRWQKSTMEGTIADIVDLKYEQTGNTIYCPVGIEMFF